ncbi:MAG TPA: DUF362 domain-containing protein [Acidobacteriota bacterium]|nr:DUF362 domain-containing protein [Acidobacteriota bacterium]
MYRKNDPVVLVQCQHYSVESIVKSLNRGLEHIGGLESFIKPGERVLLKPNLLRAAPPESAVTTHPAVVEAAIRLVREAGAEPFVGDSPGFGSANKVARAAGIEEVCLRLGVPLINFEQKITIDGIEGGFFRRFEVAKDAIEADRIINLAKAKTHQQMTLTLGVKNLFGCLPGLDKPRWHLQAGTDESYFGRMLAELAIIVAADLTILDAVVGMDGNGPGGGRVREFGFLALSGNPFALDVAVAGLFGIAPQKVPALAAGIELGAAPSSPKEIEIRGADPESLRVSDFLMPSAQRVGFGLRGFLFRALKRTFTPRVRIRHRKCVLCNACVEICPANALSNDGKRIRVSRKDCINCYCCAEVCPHEAIRIR